MDIPEHISGNGIQTSLFSLLNKLGPHLTFKIKHFNLNHARTYVQLLSKTIYVYKLNAKLPNYVHAYLGRGTRIMNRTGEENLSSAIKDQRTTIVGNRLGLNLFNLISESRIEEQGH